MEEPPKKGLLLGRVRLPTPTARTLRSNDLEPELNSERGRVEGYIGTADPQGA
jgi:hypothetical protein